ncbi:hypothetical protein ACFTQ8_19315, partial [Heyndrickxia sporothermodurans]
DIPFFSAILCLSQNNFQFIIFLCLTYYHWAYNAIHKNKLFCPWLKNRYPEHLSMSEEYWRNQSFPIAEGAIEELVVLHHCMLLSDKELLDVFIKNFKEIITL